MTRCAFGGPTGTSRVLELQLPAGSPFVNLVLDGRRTARPAAGGDSWHLAQGVFVLDPTGRAVAHRTSSNGSSDRQVVAAGQRADVPGPDLPFAREDLFLPPNLPAGTYYVAAFGSDGDPAAPDDQWGGAVEVAPTATCRPLGSGRVLDVSHADFEGGTQVSAPGAAVVDGASYAAVLAADHVVGLVDASVQGPGTAVVDAVTPAGRATVDDTLASFASPGGAFSWSAELAGVAAVASVVAMEVDLP